MRDKPCYTKHLWMQMLLGTSWGVFSRDLKPLLKHPWKRELEGNHGGDLTPHTEFRHRAPLFCPLLFLSDTHTHPGNLGKYLKINVVLINLWFLKTLEVESLVLQTKIRPESFSWTFPTLAMRFEPADSLGDWVGMDYSLRLLFSHSFFLVWMTAFCIYGWELRGWAYAL